MTIGLWIVDVQENLFPKIDRCHEILDPICFLVEAAPTLGVPIFVTEQYPAGLGTTLPQIVDLLPDDTPVWEKTTFSGYADADVRKAADQLADSWILVGIEAHICVLQTARDLREAGREVIVCNDAVSSRSLYDFSTAIGEFKEMGVRVSSTETIVYELLHDAASPQFKQLLPLIKRYA